MNPLQKILLAIAVISAFIVVMRKAMAYQRAEREELDLARNPPLRGAHGPL